MLRSQIRVWALTICLHIMASWSIFRQVGEKIREHRCCKNTLANMLIVCPLMRSDGYLSRLDETCTLLNLVAEPAHTLFLLMTNLVVFFFLSPISPFQLAMQFGFHCQGQQQQLWFMPRLGPKTQLSCCDCSCCTFGRNRVTMLHSKWHTHHVHLVPGFQAGPLASQASC